MQSGSDCVDGRCLGREGADLMSHEAVEVHIGLHTGEAVQERGDFFGKHVNLAARIGGSATGGEILVSSLLAQLVVPSGEFVLSERPAIPLKGLDGEHVTHGVEWR
jgi:class 3 adenylate cyclase